MRLPEIETDRLILRACTADDVDALHRLWTDPGVRRYLWDDEVIERSLAESVVHDSTACFSQRAFGQWIICLKDNSALAGFCGYRLTNEDADVELMYGLAPAYWHRGLATEAARAVIRYGFESLRLSRVLAATDAPNLDSVRVLERLGMRYENRSRMHDDELLHFVLTLEDVRPTDSTYRVRFV